MTDVTAIATAYIDAVGSRRWNDVADTVHPDASFEIAAGARHEGATAFLAAFDLFDKGRWPEVMQHLRQAAGPASR